MSTYATMNENVENVKSDEKTRKLYKTKKER